MYGLNGYHVNGACTASTQEPYIIYIQMVPRVGTGQASVNTPMTMCQNTWPARRRESTRKPLQSSHQ